MPKPFTLGILGAGFSGKMLASRLLSNLEFVRNTKFYLIDPDFVNGVAYGTSDPSHLLNVRASNMSAFAEDPEHFVTYLKSRFPDDGIAQKFVSRSIYSEYLNSIFNSSHLGNEAAIELIKERVLEVSVLEVSGKSDQLELSLNSRKILVDHLVLAYGNVHQDFAPSLSGSTSAQPAWPLPTQLLEKPRLLFVGTGLTMIDLALSTARLNPNCKLVAVSRNGLLPAVHQSLNQERIAQIKEIIQQDLNLSQFGLFDVFKLLRTLSKTYPWREVIDASRPFTTKVWLSLSDRQKGIFQRRLSTFWNIHRHRIAPEIFFELQTLLSSGRLKIIRGKVLSTCNRKIGTDVQILLKQGGVKEITVDGIINCAGPSTLTQLSNNPLFASLLRSELIQMDSWGIALSMNKSKDKQVLFTDKISALGPPIRGELLECTSVPELREQVKRLAELLQSHTCNQIKHRNLCGKITSI